MMYKLFIDGMGQEFVLQINTDSTKVIPKNEANIHYQEYLKWVEAGNTPLPADNIDPGA